MTPSAYAAQAARSIHGEDSGKVSGTARPKKGFIKNHSLCALCSSCKDSHRREWPHGQEKGTRLQKTAFAAKKAHSLGNTGLSLPGHGLEMVAIPALLWKHPLFRLFEVRLLRLPSLNNDMLCNRQNHTSKKQSAVQTTKDGLKRGRLLLFQWILPQRIKRAGEGGV